MAGNELLAAVRIMLNAPRIVRGPAVVGDSFVRRRHIGVSWW
jgi:hypothetical protein